MQQLNIPKVIHVGYQERNDTYTGQLAYVIYTDEKGKKRKEISWEGWRDTRIDPQDFDNEPTSGFVLNKGVGGARDSYSWNARNEYIRVYDPRGHEFEISVANLLFILQECTSSKGKGLEGEFVYSWDGTELILLPVACKEYKESMVFNGLKTLKMTRKDMVPGHTYQTKDQEELIYLGRIACRPPGQYSWNSKGSTLKDDPVTKRHIFWESEYSRYVFHTGFTKLATKVSDECDPQYADLHTTFMESAYVSKFKQVVLVPIKRPTKDYSSLFFIKESDTSYLIFSIENAYNRYNQKKQVIRYGIDTIKNMQGDLVYQYHLPSLSLKELNQQYPEAELFTIKYELESGKLIGVQNFEQ